MVKISRVVLSTALLAVASCPVLSYPSQSDTSLKPSGVSQPIKDQYVVVFKETVDRPELEAESVGRAAKGELHFTYNTAIHSGVISGLNFAAKSKLRPPVANMSLSGSVPSLLDTAVRNALIADVTVVGAAGNSKVDSCATSPAREPSAITVAATTSTDDRASYSNFGTCKKL
ncbi:MAG: hypothetical protein EBV65_08820 [Gammaproteobacteria bacterium]|jgi:hypothetical protein|nr:hypothetical protein [Gammaproteobacteria bacterium]